ncbi:MAG TPA: glycosyltransferase family 2 protein [Thermoanaerobaculia bacterium]|jgi:glycosyltransferase involved in cell wall biosynthesis
MPIVESLTVALPAYNEEANIAAMIEDVVRTVGPLAADWEVVVVDDGSRDQTAAAVSEIESREPRVRLVRHERNRGYGAAVWTGLTSARKELVFFTDSDRQFDLSEIRGLLEWLRGGDLAVGYRSPRRDPLARKINGWAWSRLVNLLFGYTARDIDCAFKVMRRSVVEALRQGVRSQGATFSAELLVRAKAAGFRIRELPVEGHRPRAAGSPTGARLSVVLRAFRELAAFRRAMWREAKV